MGEDVRDLLRESADVLAEHAPDSFHLWMTLFLQSLWELQHGDPELVERVHGPKLAALADETDDSIVRAHVSEVYAMRAIEGDPEECRAHLVEAVRHYRDANFGVSCFAHCLDHVARWAVAAGHVDEAARLLGAAEGIRAANVGATAPAFERAWHDEAKEAAADRLGTDALAERLDLGHHMHPDEAGALAGGLVGADLHSR